MDVEALLSEQIDYYRARAGEYDDWWERRREYDLGDDFNGLWRADVEQLRQSFVAFGSCGDALEFAAGTGIWTSELLRQADRVTAVDAAPEVLAINRARNGDQRVTYVEADVFSWTPPRRFECVSFAFWISHVPATRWANFWSLVERALRPGGRVWFCDSAHPMHEMAHGPDVVRGRGDPVEERGERRQRTTRDGSMFQIVKRYWTPSELQIELATLGWRATIGTTHWAFIHGSATRASDEVR